jgi:hypothetical protein
MSDLIKNLRDSSPNEGSHDLYCRCVDATAEIERLTAELAAAKHWESMWAEAQLDIVDLKAELAAANEWKSAVIDELITSWAITAEHETNPRKAVQDAISWEVQVALDPMVSSDAQKLIDSGKAKHYEECAVIADEDDPEMTMTIGDRIRAALTDTKE